MNYHLILQVTTLILICLLTNKLLGDSYNIKQKLISLCFLACLLAPFLTILEFNWQFNLKNNANITELSRPITTEKQESLAVNKNFIYENQKIDIVDNKPQYSLTEFFFILWVIGSCIKLTSTITMYLKIKTIINTGEKFHSQETNAISKNLNIIRSKGTQVPFLFGLWNTYIVLPHDASNWETQKLNHVLVHEYQHYLRKDQVLIWLNLLASIVYWFHPLIYILMKSHKENTELACDNDLIKKGTNPIKYAETLFSFSDTKQQHQLAHHMSGSENLSVKRISKLLDKTQINRKFNKIRLSLVAVLAPVFLAAATVSPDMFIKQELNQLVKFIGHQLPFIKEKKMVIGDIHLAVFYDGEDKGDTYLELEFTNQNKSQSNWMKFGPLKKFNTQIQTWHLKLLNNSEMTGNYRIQGVNKDGTVDGVALGLIELQDNNKIKIYKSSGKMNQQNLNMVCSWPLSFLDKQVLQWTPQFETSKLGNVDAVKRLICGAQLVENGNHSLF